MVPPSRSLLLPELQDRKVELEGRNLKPRVRGPPRSLGAQDLGAQRWIVRPAGDDGWG